MTLIALGVFVGIMIALGALTVVTDLVGEDPVVEPANGVFDYELSYDLLFEPAAWVRGAPAPPPVDPPAYNRPLGVQIPGVPEDDGILAPPRPVVGINNEV